MSAVIDIIMLHGLNRAQWRLSRMKCLPLDRGASKPVITSPCCSCRVDLGDLL